MDKKSKREAIILLNKSNYSLFNDIANKVKHFTWDEKHLKHRSTPTKDKYIPGINYAEFSYSNFSYSKKKFLVKQSEKK